MKANRIHSRYCSNRVNPMEVDRGAGTIIYRVLGTYVILSKSVADLKHWAEVSSAPRHPEGAPITIEENGVEVGYGEWVEEALEVLTSGILKFKCRGFINNTLVNGNQLLVGVISSDLETVTHELTHVGQALAIGACDSRPFRTYSLKGRYVDCHFSSDHHLDELQAYITSRLLVNLIQAGFLNLT